MNNYDFNYSGNMINENNSKDDILKINMIQMKWINYLLFGFTIFQLIFYIGFNIFSIISALVTLFLTYSYSAFSKSITNCSKDLDLEFIKNSFFTYSKWYLGIISLTTLDYLICYLQNNNYISSLLKADDKNINYFAYLIIYICLVKLLLLLYIRLLTSNLIFRINN